MPLKLCSFTVLGLTALMAFGAAGAAADPPGFDELPGVAYSQSSIHKSAVIERILEKSGSGTSVRVIIGMEDGFIPMGRLSSYQRQRQLDKIRSKQEEVLATLPAGKFIVKRHFANLPFMSIEIDSSQLGLLQSITEITSVEEDVLARPSLASSNVVIGSPEAWDAGYDGSSQTIVIIDTGVDASHPFFATTSKIVAEACFSTNSSGQGGTSTCPGGASSSTTPGSGGICSTSDCYHGTHVAGIAAGNDLQGPNFGVARGADLIAIQVYTDFNNTQLCGSTSPCSLSYASDQIAALDHVYSLRNTYEIAAVSMSLGDGAYSGYCDASEVSRKAAIDNLRSVGIPTIIASGNDGSRSAMQAPACISTAISVGATSDRDFVANFSNISEATSFLAPGVSITSARPGGGVATLSGTSMAAPHVAGAWAILKGKKREASYDEVSQALYQSAVKIDDMRTGGQVSDLRRINLATAIDPDPPQYTVPVSGSYVGLNGCRIVDTRRSGQNMRPLVEYPFIAGRVGQNLEEQGGNIAGCGLPSGVSAIQINITVIAEGSSGFVRSWPAGQSEPNATVFSWNGGNASNTLVLPICSATNCLSDFIVKLYMADSRIDLVIDLFGYFIE